LAEQVVLFEEQQKEKGADVFVTAVEGMIEVAEAPLEKIRSHIFIFTSNSADRFRKHHSSGLWLME